MGRVYHWPSLFRPGMFWNHKPNKINAKALYIFHPVVKCLLSGQVCMGRVCMVLDLVTKLVIGQVCYRSSLVIA